MLDPREQGKNGFGAFSERHRERRQLRLELLRSGGPAVPSAATATEARPARPARPALTLVRPDAPTLSAASLDGRAGEA